MLGWLFCMLLVAQVRLCPRVMSPCQPCSTELTAASMLHVYADVLNILFMYKICSQQAIVSRGEVCRRYAGAEAH